MIDGITILDTTYTWVCNSPAFDILIIAVFISAVWMLLTLAYDDDVTTFIISFAVFFILSISTIIVYKNYGEKVPKYKVTISDTVSFKDVYEKYDIVKQEGEIYTIIEKTTKDS